MEGQDRLSAFVKSEVRVRPLMAANASKIMQIQRQVMFGDLDENDDDEAPQNIREDEEKLLDLEDAGLRLSEVEVALQLGQMGTI